MHYSRLRANGSPMRQEHESLRLVRAVVASPPEGCIEWPMCLHNGYGKASYQGRSIGAHRLSRALYDGIDPWTHPLFALHRCDNPKCYSPLCIFWGTQAENIADMNRKGRRNDVRTRVPSGADRKPTTFRGEANTTSKLTESAVREMRSVSTAEKSTREFAEELGLDYSTVWLARTGRTWKHVATETGR